ncbi:trypsin-like peptidase domain-containing protein [Cytobacillus praedii]|uniref:trypsin-like peptidase domain-containing protein n=1 Tax=Cytobacillus praedii TaxID=1742358 RepID=UPI002E1DA26A|nr:YceG family protein [Cytobacillus praedii]
MIVRTKPLKVKLKSTNSPLEDFMTINKKESVSKEVLFVRYIGIPESIKHYTETILKIDQHMSTAPYLRLQGFERISNNNDINRLANIWENWQSVVSPSASSSNSFYHANLCAPLHNDTLEWTKKLTFMQVLSMYTQTHPNTNPSLTKNFVIKFLHWMEIYLPKLFTNSGTSPKVIFIGDIKQHELLFLYFLSKLGCDICYMNPKEDIIHLHPEAETYSTLYKCSTLYSEPIKLPAYSIKPSAEITPMPSRPNIISQPKIANPVKQIHTQVPAAELSYEQLASLSNSVVMIKVYDNENKVVCYGSGVVIHSKGYILTNLHVVQGGHLFSVLYENETEEYVTDHFIKYHQQFDLAIIKVDKHCSPLIVKTDGELVRGQKIVAIGSPLGLFNSVSDGIVSGFREINHLSMIQFTAPISNGSSGGALLDMFGRLVGLITAGFDNGQNLNLAVPSDKIYFFAQNFIEHPN